MTVKPTPEKHPVVVNSSRMVYQGRQFAFAVDDITLPNGVHTPMAVVRHPGSTGIVPIDDQGQVVLTRQYRHPVACRMLEIPAGTMDPGEAPEDCARRELEEETGLKAGRLIPMARVHILPAYSDELVHLYLAGDFTATRQNLDPDEIIDVERHPLEEVLRMIDDGRITEGLTILAVQHAWRHLNR